MKSPLIKVARRDTVDPRVILASVVREVGNTPEYEKHFKRDKDRLIVHSTKSMIQYVLGILIVIAGALLVFYLCEEQLLRKDNLTIGLIAFSTFLLAAMVTMAYRETWINLYDGSIGIKTRSYFIIRTQKLDKSKIESVRLRCIVPYSGIHGFIPLFTAALVLKDGKKIPLFTLIISQSAETTMRDTDIASTFGRLPRKAWVLCRHLNVKLDFEYKGCRISASSAEEVLAAIGAGNICS